jgi:hypothetical protein
LVPGDKQCLHSELLGEKETGRLVSIKSIHWIEDIDITAIIDECSRILKVLVIQNRCLCD